MLGLLCVAASRVQDAELWDVLPEGSLGRKDRALGRSCPFWRLSEDVAGLHWAWARWPRGAGLQARAQGPLCTQSTDITP